MSYRIESSKVTAPNAARLGQGLVKMHARKTLSMCTRAGGTKHSKTFIPIRNSQRRLNTKQHKSCTEKGPKRAKRGQKQPKPAKSHHGNSVHGRSGRTAPSKYSHESPRGLQADGKIFGFH